jgi:4-diphosphocytidyl-2-C-methyl-D-erythritol kinase
MHVTERAYAKLNLALHILGRRADGYHELDSIVAFADAHDVLTIEPAASLSLSLSGPFAQDLDGGSDNSVLAAWRLLAEAAGVAPVRLHLEKNLPVTSGIGGGTADAAAALRGLVKLFNVPISHDALSTLALKLGADVPVSLASLTCRMRGVGEKIKPLALRLPEAVVLVNPRLPSMTAKVFSTLGLDCGQPFGAPIEDLESIQSWRNDLCEPAKRLVPEIADVISVLNNQHAVTCVRMSGSGATCFGLADSLQAAEAVCAAISNAHPNWWTVATTLKQS